VRCRYRFEVAGSSRKARNPFGLLHGTAEVEFVQLVSPSRGRLPVSGYGSSE
jgi:hypothetical protein